MDIMPPLSPDRRRALTPYRRRYEEELFERVIPFWEQHSVDRTHGGYYNCLDRDGTVYDTTKHVWLQGRQVWMFSTLYREAEARAEWLEIARLGMEFLRTHALRDTGQVFFALTEDGQPIYQQRKIFSEAFYVMALAEYGRAAEQPHLVQEAKDELALLWDWAYDWSKVGRPAHAGQAPTQQLVVPMILLHLIDVVADGDASDYAAEVDDCLRRIQMHVHDETQTVRENVTPDGSLIDSPAGRLLSPGHAIENGWFVHHWADELGRDELHTLATNMIRWSYERGWDDEHGGLFYFLDAEGYSPTQLEWFMKLWWVHCEALYGHLLNYALTGDESDWAAFEAVDAYIFDHFADPEHGEWFGYLDRQGTVTHRFKGAPYKGCFHVPRALWLCIQLLDEMEACE